MGLVTNICGKRETGNMDALVIVWHGCGVHFQDSSLATN